MNVQAGETDSGVRAAQNNVVQLAQDPASHLYLHPVVYVEWGGHEFFPSSGWSYELSEFMRDVGLDPSRGGKRSDARRLQEQMRRLFRATISFDLAIDEPHRSGDAWLDMQIAPEGILWWDPRDPEQGTLWGSWVELGEKFYKAITAWPVPVDMRVLRAIRRSPLALDLYAWATWRVFKLSKSAFIPWEGLMQQMGTEYKNVDEFARKARAAFRTIRSQYAGLKLDFAKGGLVLHPSLTAIAPAPKRT